METDETCCATAVRWQSEARRSSLSQAKSRFVAATRPYRRHHRQLTVCRSLRLPKRSGVQVRIPAAARRGIRSGTRSLHGGNDPGVHAIVTADAQPLLSRSARDTNKAILYLARIGRQEREGGLVEMSRGRSERPLCVRRARPGDSEPPTTTLEIARIQHDYFYRRTRYAGLSLSGSGP